jgi:sugar transferase (PEP-CTERM/EpsH1 system associated)
VKILFVSHRFLFPLHTGGQIRTVRMLEKLRREVDVALLIQVEHPQDDQYFSAVRALAPEVHEVPFQPIPKYSARFYLRSLPRLFSRYPLAVLNDYSPALEAKLLELAATRRYDLLVCDFLQPSINFLRVRGHRTLLFQHNVESTIARRRFEKDRRPLMRLVWGLEWIKMRRYERDACRRFDGVVAVSEVDRAVFERDFGAARAYAVPTGVDTDYFRPGATPVRDNTLVFVGSMDWTPNEEGVLWFIDHVLPLVKLSVPGVTLTVVGRDPSPALTKAVVGRPDVRLTGRVPDVRPYVHEAAVCIIPLRIGGGTRIKLYEAMAMGKAVVSTSIGAEGLPVTSGRDITLADEAGDFAAAVVGFLTNRPESERVGLAARQLVERRFSWDRAAAAFAEACRHVVAGAPGPGQLPR